MSSLAPSGAVTRRFVDGPLRVLAETVETVADSLDFKRRVEELHALSDAELAALGLKRTQISHHVFSELSRA